jgi:serine/threonine-protein kinase
MADQLAPASDTLQARYTIERELGRGGMATVYLADDRKLHRPVALKVLHPELAAALGGERFLREIEIAARLSHPHILPLHDAGNAGGRLFYAMPYIQGESLRQRLEREPQLPVDEAVRITRAVAGALNAAHRAGVVHRDIKPENILLAADPGGGPAHPLVADFGIARALDAAGGERLTETGLALGTPTYMSPEQATASDRLDGRSDIYALGCLAYEMLAGVPPFAGPTAQAILARHAVDPVPPLRTVRSALPPAVEAAVERALAKVPADRFATAGEFADALTREPTGKHGWRVSPTRFRGRIVRIAGAAMLGGAVGGVLLARRVSAPPVHPSASRIAVLPFLAPGEDSALSRLGRDLAVTVSASLDGVGGIETADRLRMIQEAADRPATSPERASALARRLGARSALHGTLVGDGANVRLDLGLYDAESRTPLARGIAVTAHRDSLGALTDSVVWALLHRVWQRGVPPSASLAAVTTRSVPALRAFLDGERELERDRWEAAALAFHSATQADSTFWLAHFRYALTQYWQNHGIDPELMATVYRHREAFPERDRLLVEAWSEAAQDSLPLELDLYREATRRSPDYWPAWFLLGDRLFHVGPFLGHDWTTTQNALNRAVALNPSLKPAWVHLFFNSAGKDTVESGRARARLMDFKRAEGSPDSVGDIGGGLIDAVARSRGVIGPRDTALADSLARAYVSSKDGFQRFVWPWTLLWVGYPAAQIELNLRILGLGVETRTAAALHRGIAWTWAGRGAWDSALASMGRAVRADADPVSRDGLILEDYSLAVLGVWLGALDVEAARARRPAVIRAVGRAREEDLRREQVGRLAWLDGLLALATGDREAIARAREDAERSRDIQAANIDRSLGTFDRALAGDRTSAGRELAAREWSCSVQLACDPVTPDVAVHRLAAAGWLLEAGDTARATQLLTWHEAAIGGWAWSFSYAITPLAYLMLGRIEERRGDARSAARHYEQFLRRYDMPAPRQRHLVEEARAALVRLASGALEEEE